MRKINVLSLFDGMSCGRIALDKLDIPVQYYASEIKTDGIKVAQANYPSTTQVGSVIDLKGEDLPSIDLLIGGSPCFVAGTKVIGRYDYLDIDDVEVGDEVLTHTGKYQKVLKIGGDVKPIFKLRAQGVKETGTTANHPYYVRHSNKTWDTTKRGYKTSLSTPEWVPVSDIQIGDYVGFPVLDIEENPLGLTEEDCWLLGRYIADGHIRNEPRRGRKNSRYHQVIYSVGNSKVAEFKDKVSRHFSCYPHGGSIHRCVINSQNLVELIKSLHLGTSASTKNIPVQLLNLPRNLLRSVVLGYMSGDGCFTNGRYQANSVSSTLIQTLNLAVAKVYGILSGFSSSPGKEGHTIQGRLVNCSDTYSTYYKDTERKNYYIEGNIIWTPVKSVEDAGYSQRVYNLEVEHDNSYTANNLIVHNCQDLSIAMKNREGLSGEKSKLFFEYLRILQEVKPKYFLLENVGRMSNDNRDIISELLGVQPIRINSDKLSAQLRDRMYWTNIPQSGTLVDKGINLQDILTTGYTDRLKARCLLESDSRPLATPVKMFHRYYSTGFTTLIFKSKEHYDACKSHYDNNFKGGTAREINDYTGDLSVYGGLRYLNQEELEILQTVPKGYTSTLTRNNAAGLLGDGWTVDVIVELLRGIEFP